MVAMKYRANYTFKPTANVALCSLVWLYVMCFEAMETHQWNTTLSD
jgi:hypothetical protein